MKHTIYQGNALKVLKKIPDNSVDLIFTDPPYNIGKDYGKYKDKLKIEDYYVWCRKWILECERILKSTGSFFLMNYTEHLSILLPFLKNKFNLINWIIWIRNDNQFYNKNKQFKRNHQDILFLVKDKEKYYFNWRSVGRLAKWSNDKRVKDLAGLTDTWSDITYVKGNSLEKTEVNNQLPIKLLKRIIKCSTKKGDIVCDPFLGSGTTTIAAEKLGRNSIGIEINEDYVNIAKKRMKPYVGQTNLIGGKCELIIK